MDSQVFTARAQDQLHDGLARETVLSDPAILEREKARYRNDCGEVIGSVVILPQPAPSTVEREAEDLLKRPASARRTVCQVSSFLPTQSLTNFAGFAKFGKYLALRRSAGWDEGLKTTPMLG